MVKKRSFEFATRFSDFEKELEEREEKEATKIFKICSRCGERKPVYQFSRDKRNTLLGGLANVCKACRIIEYMNYYQKNKSEILAKEKKYRDTNGKDRSKYYKDYQEKHKEQLKEKARKWYKRNREKIKARNLEYYKKHEQACRVRRKIWREKNKEKIKKYNREYNKNYRQKSQRGDFKND